jgi:capsular exopolysaccharide synthesis family protein
MDDRQIQEWLERNVKIELLRRSNQVKFSARSSDPKQAADIATLYVTESMESAFQINREKSTNAVAWLQSQIELQRKELEKTEQALLEFRGANPLETLLAQQDTVKEAMQANSKTLTEALSKRDELLARYTERHPEGLVQEQIITAARAQFNEQVKKAEEMESKINNTRTRLAALERERESSELTFKGMLRRMEEARLSSDENTTSMQIIERAYIPENPVWPRKFRVLFLAIFAGLGAGCMLALFTVKLEDRVWHLADITSFIGFRLLGLIPHTEANGRERLALKSHEDKFCIFTEAYASVRGMIDASVKGKTYMVTSAMPEEGKTVSAVNLAIAWAKTGNRTLLVDLDMRRPRHHKIFNVSTATHNLLEALSDGSSADMASLPRETEIKNLQIVVSRVETDLSPAEVLGSRRIREFLKWASENFDRVVLDTPPVGVASESLVLSGMVEGIVLVCRFNFSKKSITKSAASRLQDAGGSIVGVVLNDIKGDISALSGQIGSYYYSKSPYAQKDRAVPPV